MPMIIFSMIYFTDFQDIKVKSAKYQDLGAPT